MPAPSQTPVRYPSGVTTAPPYSPLADYGYRDPFFWHEWEDDFDVKNPQYVSNVTGNGTAALAAGDGGLLLLTTNSSTPVATDYVAVTLPIASFQMPIAATVFPSQMKKLIFATRFQCSDMTNAAFTVGLTNLLTTTYFTGGITDGIYLNKASGVTTVNLIVVSASVVQLTLPIPAAFLASYIANATYVDLAFEINRQGSVLVGISSQFFGWVPQSGSGAVNPTTGVSNLPVIPWANAYRVEPGGTQGQYTNPLLAFTAVNLALVFALNSGTASAKTATFDFIMAAKER